MRLISAWFSAAIAFWAACMSLALATSAYAQEPTFALEAPRSASASESTRFHLTPDWNFTDQAFKDERPLATFSVSPVDRQNFLPETRAPGSLDETERRFDLSFATRTVIPALQVGVAQRAEVKQDDDDSVRLLGREIRLGDLGVGEFESPTWDNPQWYVFAASDDGALTWTPAARREGVNALRYQEDRISIGDFQAGLSIEASGVQAALSYVQREVSLNGKSEDGSFTGFSVTLRR